MKRTQSRAPQYCRVCKKLVPGLDHHCNWCGDGLYLLIGRRRVVFLVASTYTPLFRVMRERMIYPVSLCVVAQVEHMHWLSELLLLRRPGNQWCVSGDGPAWRVARGDTPAAWVLHGDAVAS